MSTQHTRQRSGDVTVRVSSVYDEFSFVSLYPPRDAVFWDTFLFRCVHEFLDVSSFSAHTRTVACWGGALLNGT